MPRSFAFAMFVIVNVTYDFHTAHVYAAGAAEIAVRIDDAGAVIVPVTINDAGPFPFMLDTGATHSVVSSTLVEHLDLRFVAKTEILTSTGREWRPVVVLDQTTIGAARPERLFASVTPSAQLEAISRGIEGIIGQDFLFGLNYTLDYRRQRLTWSAENTAADGVRLPLLARGGRYLVRIPAGGAADSALLVADSGASGLVAYQRHGSTRFALHPANDTRAMLVHSLSGAQGARTMLLRELRLGDVTVKNLTVAVVERDPADAIEGDGLLPLHLFDSVSFDAREGYLILRGVRKQ